jgi:hypothetical protein
MPSSRDPKIQEQGEETQLSKVFREFKGVNTQSDRTAIPEDCFYRLDNLQPIGNANIHTVPEYSAVGTHSITGTPYWQQYANINNTDYVFVFCTNGNVYQVNITPGSDSYTLINPATPLSGGGSRMDQWNGGATDSGNAILIVDSSGYYSWDGTTFTLQTGSGAPSSGTEIAVYAGRVWIFQSRLVIIGAAGSYKAASSTFGAGSVVSYLTDPQLRGPVVRAISANGYLYYFSKSSIFVFSDVYVPSGATTPVYTNTNVHPLIGTDQPGSVFVINRDVYFANSYGAHRIQGVTVERISKDIDGTWQYLDFTVPIFGGATAVNNILTAAFMVKQKQDPFFGTQLAIWMFSDDKWWRSIPTFFPSCNGMCWAMAAGRPTLIASWTGSSLKDVFGLPAYNAPAAAQAAPASSFATSLWSLGDPIPVKEAIQVGVEITNVFTPGGGVFQLNLDTPTSSIPFISGVSPGLIQWQNNSLALVTWQNNALVTVNWYNGAYLLQTGDSGGGYGHYIGVSGSAPVNSVYQLNTIEFDYEFRNRWT